MSDVLFPQEPPRQVPDSTDTLGDEALDRPQSATFSQIGTGWFK